MDPMLTTVDNPYDPHDEYELWYKWDTSAGYHSSAYLARVLHTADGLSEVEQDNLIRDAIAEIIDHDALGVFTISEKQNESG